MAKNIVFTIKDRKWKLKKLFNKTHIFSLCLSLALRMTRRNSFLKVLLQFAIEGPELLNIHTFLCDQMLQHMMMIISMAKGTKGGLSLF
jgi:hypothetical protein